MSSQMASTRIEVQCTPPPHYATSRVQMLTDNTDCGCTHDTINRRIRGLLSWSAVRPLQPAPCELDSALGAVIGPLACCTSPPRNAGCHSNRHGRGCFFRRRVAGCNRCNADATSSDTLSTW